MHTSDFDYELPIQYIAQTPLEQRDQSRLLIMDRGSGEIQHAKFSEVGNYLNPGDILVLNETRVIPARLFGHKLPGGGRVEILLLRKRDALTWEALVGGKGLSVGKQLQLEARGEDEALPRGEVIKVLNRAERLIHFDKELEPFFPRIGHAPLPPYIHTQLKDPERYQTVYAKTQGSAAAPTAGLHFTPELISNLMGKGILFARLTLHVGLDTFAPVTEDDPSEHQMHNEWCQVTEETADIINLARSKGGRVIAVGTTSVRTLESASLNGRLRQYEGATDLFILPGYRFQIVDGMITNFHLPRSTLIMLVSAFAGRDHVLNAYKVAKNANYRFYSFGDAMFII